MKSTSPYMQVTGYAMVNKIIEIYPKGEIPFYDSISRWYKYIFPAQEAQLRFFKDKFESLGVSRVLDVACGTGEYTRAFVEWGIGSVGIDLDQSMIDQAKEEQQHTIVKADYLRADMINLPFEDASFDACVCIGNSFVHLLQEAQRLQAIREMFRILKPEGILILQTVNYDRILQERIPQLPTINNDKVGLAFERYYNFREDGFLDFMTVLRIQDNNQPARVIQNTVPLYPLTKDEMLKLLKETGFSDIKTWSGFSNSPWNMVSFATVVEACKRE